MNILKSIKLNIQRLSVKIWLVNIICSVVIETAVVIIDPVCYPWVIYCYSSFYVLLRSIILYLQNQSLIDFTHIPIWRDWVFGGSNIKTPLLYFSLIDEIGGNPLNIVTVIYIGQVIYLLHTGFAKCVNHYTIVIPGRTCNIS